MASFVRWLHEQALRDEKGEMPYAGLYSIGQLIEAVLGEEGQFDLTALTTAIREKCTKNRHDKLIGDLVLAEATWRTDTAIVQNPEIGNVRTPRQRKGTCCFIGVDGERCSTSAVAGAGRCIKHGGAITDPEVRRSILIASYARLIEGTEQAVSTLVEVAASSNNDLARVQAAKELLDRAGIAQDQTVKLQLVDESNTEDGVKALKAHLAQIKERLSAPLPLPPVQLDDEVVEAEIVPDP